MVLGNEAERSDEHGITARCKVSKLYFPNQVNAAHGTKPHVQYFHPLVIINKLVEMLAAPALHPRTLCPHIQEQNPLSLHRAIPFPVLSSLHATLRNKDKDTMIVHKDVSL